MGIFDGLFDDILGNVGGTARTDANGAVRWGQDQLLDLLGLGYSKDATGVNQQLWDTARSLPTPQYDKVNLQNSVWNPSTMTWTNAGPAQGYDAENWNANLINEDPAMRNQQLANLDKYNELANKGFDEVDRANNNRILQDAAAQSQRQGQAITDNLNARGMGGGGNELLQRQLASQGASEQAYRTGLSLAEQNRSRRDSALNASTALAGNVRATDLNTEARNASMANDAAQSNAYMNTMANKYLADQNNQTNLYNNKGLNNSALENFNAANTAGRFNATNQNDINKSNRDYEMQRERNQNADELNRFNAMMNAGNAYSKQLNANEAAAALRNYANQMGGGYGSGNYGTGNGGYGNGGYGSGSNGSNSSNPYAWNYGNGTNGSSGSGNWWDDIFGTGNGTGYNIGDTLDPNDPSWSWADGNGWDGNGDYTYVPPDWTSGNTNFDDYWNNPYNYGDWNAGDLNMGSNEPGQAWYSPDGAYPGGYGDWGVNDPNYGQDFGQDPYGNTIIDPTWGPGNASYDAMFPGNVGGTVGDIWGNGSNDLGWNWDNNYDYGIGTGDYGYDTGSDWFGGWFEKGGKAPVGKVSIVGENGPEAIIPGKDGTKVIPNDKLDDYFFPPKFDFKNKKGCM